VPPTSHVHTHGYLWYTQSEFRIIRRPAMCWSITNRLQRGRSRKRRPSASSGKVATVPLALPLLFYLRLSPFILVPAQIIIYLFIIVINK
jgi:hypothetical protein